MGVNGTQLPCLNHKELYKQRHRSTGYQVVRGRWSMLEGFGGAGQMEDPFWRDY